MSVPHRPNERNLVAVYLEDRLRLKRCPVSGREDSEKRKDDLVDCPEGTKGQENEEGRLGGLSWMREDDLVGCPEGTKTQGNGDEGGRFGGLS